MSHPNLSVIFLTTNLITPPYLITFHSHFSHHYRDGDDIQSRF